MDLQKFAKTESCFEDWRSKYFQWENRVLLSKMRAKCAPILELLRTSTHYFHQKSFKKHIFTT